VLPFLAIFSALSGLSDDFSIDPGGCLGPEFKSDGSEGLNMPE